MNGMRMRIWEGETDSGIKVHAYIPRIACDENEANQELFRVELLEQKKPSGAIEAIPLSLII